MAYLKRNINMLLLITTILLIGYTLTLTTYYQQTFQNVTLKYYEQVGEYESLIGEFEERERILNETSFELTRKTESSEKLEDLYTEVANERDALDAQLTSTKAQLNSANVKIVILESDIDEYDSLSRSISSEVSNVIDDVEDDTNLTSGDLDDIFDRLNDLVADLKDVS